MSEKLIDALRIIAVVSSIILLVVVFRFVSEHNIRFDASSYTNHECADVYSASEVYFSRSDTFNVRIRVIHFTNGQSDSMPRGYVEDRLNSASDVFFESGFNAKFLLDRYVVIRKSPREIGDRYFSNMQSFSIEDFKVINNYLYDPSYMTVYIYTHDSFTDFAGSAGGIPSNYMAIRLDHFRDFRIKTLEHELGHTFGLRHTHQPDPTDGRTYKYGDKVCDTPFFYSFMNSVDNECEYVGSQTIADVDDEDIDKLIKNIMSYAIGCRTEFTEGQSDFMFWNLEQSDKLLRTVQDEDTPFANPAALDQLVQ